MSEPETPRKPFRDEAKTGSVACLSCGAPIELHGFGGTTQISCAYCGSTLRPADSGELELAQAAERQRRSSVLPLYARGILRGIECEIIGIAWRETVVDGVAYPWQEFLLFNPYQGYRWLIYSDGWWSIAETLDGAPLTKYSAHRSVEFGGALYRHFQSSNGVVTYVEGEFPWQIQVGDRAQLRDYIAPPRGISVEMTQLSDGADIVFSGVEHVDVEEVWTAFGMTSSPPTPRGVGMLTPNPHRATAPSIWKMFAVLMLAWLVITGIYVGARDREVVVDLSPLPSGANATTVALGPPDSTGTVKVTLESPSVGSGYAHADLSLVHKATGSEQKFALQADGWGDNPATVVLGGIPGGDHSLKFTMKYDSAVAATAPTNTRLVMRRDVSLARYWVLPLVVILFFPFFNAIRGGAFEARRWANSDYAHHD